MKNLIAINGSPRRNWNTAQLLQHAMQGAEEKFAYREKHFPEDCKAAYEIGRELILK